MSEQKPTPHENEPQPEPKLSYETPKLTHHGAIERLTQFNTGSAIDGQGGSRAG